MVGLLLLGLAWVVTYYLSQSKYPIPDIVTGTWRPGSASCCSVS
jgi:hypothetical protein